MSGIDVRKMISALDNLMIGLRGFDNLSISTSKSMVVYKTLPPRNVTKILVTGDHPTGIKAELSVAGIEGGGVTSDYALYSKGGALIFSVEPDYQLADRISYVLNNDIRFMKDMGDRASMSDRNRNCIKALLKELRKGK
jgi:hypothetical protein